MPPGGPAEGFRQTRAAHRSETAEDYVELIADLIDVRGEARLVEMAKHLGITQATVATPYPACSVMAWSSTAPTGRSS